jgi:cell division protein ZapE
MAAVDQPAPTGPHWIAARLRAEVASRRLQHDPAQVAAARHLDALRNALTGRPPGVLDRLHRAVSSEARAKARTPRGVYLWGGVGRGKTLLMDLFFSSLRDAPGAPPAERSHFYHFMRDVHAQLAAVRQLERPLDAVAARVAARTRVICLDEFFVADIADAMILSALFESLFGRGVALVATSNLRPEDLYKDGLQRQRFLPAIAMIEAKLDVVRLDGGIDYRLRQLEQAPTYLDSNHPGTKGALAARFASLGGDAAGPAVLDIAGRPLRAVNCAAGTVWFDFRELCGGPRSQMDYIEIARLYHTVFIDDIPLFDAPDDDAARRFIMLIDEFYDRGVKIVVSAAAKPAALYRGERLRAEFERAASRLVEMQTQAYLAGQHRP